MFLCKFLCLLVFYIHFVNIFYGCEERVSERVIKQGDSQEIPYDGDKMIKKQWSTEHSGRGEIPERGRMCSPDVAVHRQKWALPKPHPPMGGGYIYLCRRVLCLVCFCLVVDK